MTIRIDGVRHRFDAGEGIFFARELESIEEVLYEFKQRELKYRELVPVSNRDNPGAESITYRMFDKIGMAKIIGNYADDLPRADVFGQEFTQPVKSIGESFGYNTQEIRAALMAQRPLDQMKAAAARRAVHEKENRICWSGDAEYGLPGFLNNANIPASVATTGAGGDTWVLKTPDEILADVRLGVSTIRSQSKGIHQADTLLLPIPQYDIAAMTARSATSDTTIMGFIKDPKNSFGLANIDWLDELEVAFVSGTKDGAFFYENDKEVVEQRIPLEMISHPVQERNLEFIVPIEARNGGVVVRYPLGCFVVTGI